MDQASMEMVKAVGMVILRVPAAPPVMYPPVMLPKPRLGGPLSCNTTSPSAPAAFPSSFPQSLPLAQESCDKMWRKLAVKLQHRIAIIIRGSWSRAECQAYKGIGGMSRSRKGVRLDGPAEGRARARGW